MTSSARAASPLSRALSPERLAALVDREVELSDRMLFTITPREELDAIRRAQELDDLVFVHKMRVIVAASSRLDRVGREFAADELALMLRIGPTTAMRLRYQANALAALPGVLEAVEAHWLSEAHVLAMLRELDEVPELSLEQRIAVATIVLARVTAETTPGEVRTLTRRLVLTIDLDAAKARQDAADSRRGVRFWPVANGQAVSQATGPLQRIAAIEASLRRWLAEHPKEADDPRSEDERMFDLYVALLTGGTEPGSWQAQIVVPFTTADGGELELAEIPGYGPVLPSTARELLDDADWSQVAVDQDGVVIAVSDPVPAPRRSEAPTEPTEPGDAGSSGWSSAASAMPVTVDWDAERLRMMASRPVETLMPERISINGYVASNRIKRFLQARDRHCVFPGCHRRITDVDHRIPWPLGPTAVWNLQLLCRHHHRAKQWMFTVQLTDDGDYLWTTRGGWQFLRRRKGY